MMESHSEGSILRGKSPGRLSQDAMVIVLKLDESGVSHSLSAESSAAPARDRRPLSRSQVFRRTASSWAAPSDEADHSPDILLSAVNRGRNAG